MEPGAGRGEGACRGRGAPHPSPPGPAACREGPRDPSDSLSSGACNGMTPVPSPPQPHQWLLLGMEPAAVVAWPAGLVTALSPNGPLGGTGKAHWGLDLLRRDTISASLDLSFLATQHLGGKGLWECYSPMPHDSTLSWTLASAGAELSGGGVRRSRCRCAGKI